MFCSVITCRHINVNPAICESTEFCENSAFKAANSAMTSRIERFSIRTRYPRTFVEERAIVRRSLHQNM